MERKMRILRGPVAAMALSAVAFISAHARADEAAAADRTAPPTWAEFTKLQNEVHDQRNLLIQLMQTEQQRYDMLLKLLSSAAPSAAASLPPAVGVPVPAPEEKRARGASAAAGPRATAGERTGVLEGKVDVPGGDVHDVYVYVENIKAARATGTVEIKQENKQFSPRLAVVPIGTTVTFPNLDPVFHNVFSNSAANSFDLGSYRAGDQTRSVVMTKPGVVDVYCNMHQRMSAHVLVVPSKLFVKVRPDGSFRLEGVPLGSRSVVAWSPNLRPAQRKVEMTPAGARATFAMEYTDPQAHTNKVGQPYGSYNE
jgi:plastocyanin